MPVQHIYPFGVGYVSVALRHQIVSRLKEFKKNRIFLCNYDVGTTYTEWDELGRCIIMLELV